ncbi:hypothetical protein HMPREF0731_0345, partial [Pseudoroseomonas cervicalis ATCC 49957]
NSAGQPEGRGQRQGQRARAEQPVRRQRQQAEQHGAERRQRRQQRRDQQHAAAGQGQQQQGMPRRRIGLGHRHRHPHPPAGLARGDMRHQQRLAADREGGPDPLPGQGVALRLGRDAAAEMLRVVGRAGDDPPLAIDQGGDPARRQQRLLQHGAELAGGELQLQQVAQPPVAQHRHHQEHGEAAAGQRHQAGARRLPGLRHLLGQQGHGADAARGLGLGGVGRGGGRAQPDLAAQQPLHRQGLALEGRQVGQLRQVQGRALGQHLQRRDLAGQLLLQHRHQPVGGAQRVLVQVALAVLERDPGEDAGQQQHRQQQRRAEQAQMEGQGPPEGTVEQAARESYHATPQALPRLAGLASRPASGRHCLGCCTPPLLRTGCYARSGLPPPYSTAR